MTIQWNIAQTPGVNWIMPVAQVSGAVPGTVGWNGWSPALSIVADGERRVLRVIGWLGGTGTAPTVGQYLGAEALVNDIAEALDIRGAGGDDGETGWSPTLAVVSDGARRVMQVVAWQGGTGSAPATGFYVGPEGLVSDIAEAVDVRGSVGPGGNAGWTPVLAVVADDERRVLQVLAWQGGEGSPPATGLYVGPEGLVSDIAEAVNVRGTAGPPGSGAGVPPGGTTGQVLTKASAGDGDAGWQAPAVQSVAGKSGTVVLVPGDVGLGAVPNVDARARSSHTGTQSKSSISDFAHGSSHHSGGGDAIKLDALATPDDTTNLNATTERHGLLRKLSGVATEFLAGDGVFRVPAGSGTAPAAEIHLINEDTEPATTVRVVSRMDGSNPYLSLLTVADGPVAVASIPMVNLDSGHTNLWVAKGPAEAPYLAPIIPDP